MSVSHDNTFKWLGRVDPEDGEAARRFYHLSGKNHDRAILGFSCDAGVARNKGRIGAASAPHIIRRALANLAVPVNGDGFTDLGDINVIDDALEAGQTHLAIMLDKNLRKFKRILVLGGGHETAFGSFSGLKLHYPERRIGILNLDAHLDLRAISAAGPSSGTPFYQMRELDPIHFDYLCLGVAHESNTQALFQRAKDWGVEIVDDRSLINDPASANKAITNLIARNDLVYLTIDLDVLPHYQMPGVSAPAARGVPLETIEKLIELCLETCAANGKEVPIVDIVEYSPPFDLDGVAAKTAAYLARKIMLS